MNGTVREWIDKAEADFATAGRELCTETCPNYDAVCFHAQQCIEKMMKGALIHLGETPPHIHDLAELSRLVSLRGANWSAADRDLRYLSQGAVIFRYPGESATREDAAEALAICERLREKLLKLLKV